MLAALTGTLGASSAATAQPIGPPLVTLIPGVSNGPFSDGEYVDVEVGPNPILKRGHDLVIEECSAPLRPGWDWQIRCDRRTIQPNQLRAGHHGTVDYMDYPVYSLPNASVLGEGKRHRPVCDLTHACVIMVGWDIDDHGHEVWSAPFYVDPDAGDPGDPPGGLPETPYVLAFPVLALGIFGGWVFVKRRRSTVHSG